MLSTELVTIVAASEHRRTVMELACDWRKAQVDFDAGEPQIIDYGDGRVIVLGFPAAALPVLTRGNVPYEIYDGPPASGVQGDLLVEKRA